MIHAMRLALLIATIAPFIATTHAVETAPPAAPPAATYSATSLYNSANTFARDGKPGLAVLNYERARLLAPHDADIAANLQLTRENAKLPPERITWFDRAARTASPQLASWLGLLGLLVAGSALLARYRFHARRTLSTALILAGFALMGVTVANAVTLWPILHGAVVITPATPVRVSPVPMGEPLFVLPEGDVVRIDAEHDDFMLIHTSAGRAGWVTRANVMRIVPR